MNGPHTFSPEQMEILMLNPYTLSVTPTSIRHTYDFKRYVVREQKAGKTSLQIFENAGYDPEMLGRSRIVSSVHRFVKEDASEKGIQPTAAEKKAFKKKEEVKNVKDLEKRIEYLESELELLKKSYALKMRYMKKD